MRSGLVRAALIALVFSLPAASLAAPAVKKKAPVKTSIGKSNWLATGHRTADGAIVIGNPAAKVKIVEYLSLTCPHCAMLSGEMMTPLQRDYIARGLVSLEVRHAVRDGYDFVASLLLRCEPAERYLGSIEALFATQNDWMAKGVNAKAVSGFEAMPPDEKFATVARIAGFEGFFAKRGMDAKTFAACLASGPGKDQLTRMAGNSWERDAIPGTPLIVINGARQEGVHEWGDIEPLIKGSLKP